MRLENLAERTRFGAVANCHVRASATHEICVFDTQSFAQVAVIAIASEQRRLLCDGPRARRCGRLFTVGRKTDEVAEIGLAANTATRVLRAIGAKNAAGIAYDGQSRRIFVASQDSGNLVILDMDIRDDADLFIGGKLFDDDGPVIFQHRQVDILADAGVQFRHQRQQDNLRHQGSPWPHAFCVQAATSCCTVDRASPVALMISPVRPVSLTRSSLQKLSDPVSAIVDRGDRQALCARPPLTSRVSAADTGDTLYL